MMTGFTNALDSIVFLLTGIMAASIGILLVLIAIFVVTCWKAFRDNGGRPWTE